MIVKLRNWIFPDVNVVVIDSVKVLLLSFIELNYCVNDRVSLLKCKYEEFFEIFPAKKLAGFVYLILSATSVICLDFDVVKTEKIWVLVQFLRKFITFDLPLYLTSLNTETWSVAFLQTLNKLANEIVNIIDYEIGSVSASSLWVADFQDSESELLLRF